MTSRRAHCTCAILLAVLALLSAHTSSAADIIKGAQLYAMHCTACHGPRGVSVMPNAPHLARGERMLQSDLTLLATLRAGKNAMPAYLGILSDRDILDVIAYSRTLRQ
ncbi:MAG: c-type cytochrome [Betaproteobacteria bacterium]